MVLVGVADDPGQRPWELEVGTALQRGELEVPLSSGPEVGVLVLVLDVEHPGGDHKGPESSAVAVLFVLAALPAADDFSWRQPLTRQLPGAALAA